MNYQETSVSGTSYIRCRQVEIRNPYQETPTVTFTEERITTIGDSIIKDQNTAPITMVYEPNLIVPLVDPVTLQPTEQTVSMDFLHLAVLSVYMYLATIRDTPSEEIIPVEVPEVEVLA